MDSTFVNSYKTARNYIETAVENEKNTLETITELATDKKFVGDYLQTMKTTIDHIGSAHLKALEKHMRAVADRLNIKFAKIQLTNLEKKSSKLIPKPTVKEVVIRPWEEYEEKPVKKILKQRFLGKTNQKSPVCYCNRTSPIPK